MNIDNAQDFIKRHGKLEISDGISNFLVLSCFVDENRKTSFIIEKETIIAEGSEFEIETKEIGFLPCSNYKVITEDKASLKAFGKAFDNGHINMTKISVPKFDEDLYDEILETLEQYKEELVSIIKEAIIFSVRNTSLSIKKSMGMASYGLTNFGKLPFVIEVYETNKQSIYEECFREEYKTPKNLYSRYFTCLEKYMSQVSAINMIKDENTKITITKCTEHIKGNDASSLQEHSPS